MNLHIFKTNIKLKKDVNKVKSFLAADESIIKWNVDRQDSDKILRIESSSDNPNEIIKTIKHAGYDCEELQDA
jgi:hypothetical protein